MYTDTGGQDAVSGLTTKQRELLVQCKLELRLLDPAFLEAAGQDKKPALIRALEVGTAGYIQLLQKSDHAKSDR